MGCRTRVAATGMLRVVAVNGILVPDPRRRRPGRGAWVHPDPGCLRTAERRRAFPRALRVAGMLDTAQVHDHLAQLDGDATTGPGFAPGQAPTGPDYPGARSSKRETGRSDMHQQP